MTGGERNIISQGCCKMAEGGHWGCNRIPKVSQPGLHEMSMHDTCILIIYIFFKNCIPTFYVNSQITSQVIVEY